MALCQQKILYYELIAEQSDFYCIRPPKMTHKTKIFCNRHVRRFLLFYPFPRTSYAAVAFPAACNRCVPRAVCYVLDKLRTHRKDRLSMRNSGRYDLISDKANIVSREDVVDVLPRPNVNAPETGKVFANDEVYLFASSKKRHIREMIEKYGGLCYNKIKNFQKNVTRLYKNVVYKYRGPKRG